MKQFNGLTSWDYRQMTVDERFWSKVSPEPNTGCWLWVGGIDPRGYGVFTVENKTVRANVWSYERFKGPRNGLFVCHECDVTSCVNPEHFFLGTHSDNMRDMFTKGRENPGGRNGPRKTFKWIPSTPCKRQVNARSKI